MKHLLNLIVLLSALLSIPAVAQETTIFPKGEKAPNVHHTGDVWLSHVSDADGTFDYNIAHVVMAPGAKLDWHRHPEGQQLIITEGTGSYQERNKPVQILHKGDVVQCLPDVEHWHAATPETGVAYLAITGNQSTEWLEPVSKQEFSNIDLPATSSTSTVGSNAEQEIKDLSQQKWQWMADKNVDTLANLFHEKAQFVHMGGSWGKDQELNIIKSGGIWYKQADIHEVSVNMMGNTAILLNRIDLLAEVGGNQVTNPFEVTEVYVKQNGTWKLGSLSFTKLLNP